MEVAHAAERTSRGDEGTGPRSPQRRGMADHTGGSDPGGSNRLRSGEPDCGQSGGYVRSQQMMAIKYAIVLSWIDMQSHRHFDRLLHLCLCRKPSLEKAAATRVEFLEVPRQVVRDEWDDAQVHFRHSQLRERSRSELLPTESAHWTNREDAHARIAVVTSPELPIARALLWRREEAQMYSSRVCASLTPENS